MNELGRRVAVAAVGIPIALFAILSGGWFLTAFIALISYLVAVEFFVLAASRGPRPFSGLGAAAALAVVLSAGLTRSYSQWAPLVLAVLVGVFLLSSALSIWRRWPDGQPMAAISSTLLGVVCGGVTLSFAVLLRHLPEAAETSPLLSGLNGAALLALPLAVTWVADSAAYFGGHWLGRRKLIPRVSPGKTVAGSVAGLLGATAAGMIMGWLFLSFSHQLAGSIAIGGGLGLVLGVGAQVGDLIESLLKREAGIKDSGTLLPGHGGLLDRFDALIFNLPLTYLLLLALGRVL